MLRFAHDPGCLLRSICLLGLLFSSSALATIDVCDAFGPLEGTISSPDAAWLGPADALGAAVVTGDFDGDGALDLAVGAPEADLGGVDAGAVYVFFGPLDATGPADLSFADAVLVGMPGARAGTALGQAPSLWRPDALVIGAPGRGEAFLVRGVRPGRSSLRRADARFFGAAPGDRFGATVSGLGDVDGDGHGDLIIGAPGSALGAVGGGAAYVWSSAARGPQLASSAAWTLFGDAAGARFGAALVHAGDVDGDGLDDIVVGSPGGAGAVSVFFGDRVPAGLRSQPDVLRWGDAAGDRAGAALAAAGDVDGDGLADLWASAPEGGRLRFGLLTLQLGVDLDVDGSLAASSRRTLVGQRAGFGAALAGGDLDGDGAPDVIVGGDNEASVYYGPDWARAAGHLPAVWPAVVASDLNADGFDDVLLGDRSRSGAGLFFGGVDAFDLRTWYPDADGDGFGQDYAWPQTVACEGPPGFAALPGDCNDADPATWPGAPEDWCDGVRQDCEIDELVYWPPTGTVSILPSPLRAGSVPTASVALTTTWCGPPQGLSYAWSVDGVVLPDQTGPSLVGVALRGGQQVGLTVTSPRQFENVEEATFSVVATVANTPPTLAACTASPSQVDRWTDLSGAAVGPADLEGDPVTVSFRWQKRIGPLWYDIPGATSDTLLSCEERYVAGGQYNCARGDQLRLTCTPADPLVAGTPVVSSTITVLGSAPYGLAVALSPEDLRSDDELVLSVTPAVDFDNDRITYDLTWRRDDAVWATGPAAPFVVTGLVRGERWSVTATATDLNGSVTAADEVSVGNALPALAGAVLNPANPRAGDLVTASPVGANDHDGDVLVVSTVFYVDGALVAAPSVRVAAGQEVYAVLTPSDAWEAGAEVVTETVVVGP